MEATTSPSPISLNDTKANPNKPETRRELRRLLEACDLHKAFMPTRHEDDDVLEIQLKGVYPATEGSARFQIEKYVGGGFAGQVYRARLLELKLDGESIPGLRVDNVYALKFLRPPSGFSSLFRNMMYRAGFQAHFAPQVRESAARTGALWQKLIRRGAKVRLGGEQHVADIHATFFDPILRCHADVVEWVEGRQWKLETDEKLFERRRFLRSDEPLEGEPSPEYLGKRRFLRRLVRLFHEMGAPELARQYEWSTWKSQPNAIKRLGKDDALTAIDFRPGLALLFGLPMSPADVGLVFKGLFRGRLAQFDGCNLDTLDQFIKTHESEFEDLAPVVEELRKANATYRASQPAILNHPIRALTRVSMPVELREGTCEAWQKMGRLDPQHVSTLSQGGFLFRVLYLFSLIPVLGRIPLKWWGLSWYSRHFVGKLTSPRYLMRSLRAARIKRLIEWHREHRIDDAGALARVDRPLLCLCEAATLAWLPRSWHRFLGSSVTQAFGQVKKATLFPIQFYAKREIREAWLLGQVESARSEGMLTDQEEERIRTSISDPFIQKYLKCIGVHICMMPTTKVFSLSVAFYVFFTYGQSWPESFAMALGIVAAIQMLPISPGSIARGTYVVYLMISERNFRDYRVAALVSFWHYIGYLGFPIQMVTRYPTLARFVAARWAKGLVRHVPIFGEAGALLEHKVFDIFFNLPITFRARWAKQSE